MGWGLAWLGFVPFPVLANVVLLNNLLAAGLIAPLVLRALYPRVERAQLLVADVFPRAGPTRVRAVLGLALFFTATIAGHVAGDLAATGAWRPPWGWESTSPTHAAEVGLGVAPFVVLAALGLALL